MQFKRAQERLANQSNDSHWALLLEQEYEQFKHSLTEWTDLQAEKYQQARRTLQEKWEKAALRTRYKELEYSMKMQRKRMKLMLNQMAVA